MWVLLIFMTQLEKDLYDTFIKHQEKLKANISDCRGQFYDNGSNMQENHQDVQKRVLDTNKKALWEPYLKPGD